MTTDTTPAALERIMERLREDGQLLARAGMDGRASSSMIEAAAVIAALVAERDAITKHLDEGSVACAGGTMDWSLPDRVLIAVQASNDTEML